VSEADQIRSLDSDEDEISVKMLHTLSSRPDKESKEIIDPITT